jgi:hypothetical protein
MPFFPWMSETLVTLCPLPVLLSPIRKKYLPEVHKCIGKGENDPTQAHTSYTPLMILYKFKSIKNKFREHNKWAYKIVLK